MTGDMMLQRGDLMPRFEVNTVEGAHVDYSTIWQRRNLVLVALPALESGAAASYISQLKAREPDFTAAAAQCVITREPVPGIPSPGLVVADRWGEIVHAAHPPRVDDLASAEALLEWVTFLEQKCPECEGEAK